MEHKLIVKKAGVATSSSTFVISSEDPDLVGDVVVQDGLIPVADRVPAQLDHSGKMADLVGVWKNFTRTGKQTLADLELLPEGVSKAADLVRAMMDSGLQLAASIGFIPLEAEPIKGARRGVKFNKASLTEVSIVVSPCHPQALQMAKSFGIDLSDVDSADTTSVKTEQMLKAKLSKQRASQAIINAKRSIKGK